MKKFVLGCFTLLFTISIFGQVTEIDPQEDNVPGKEEKVEKDNDNGPSRWVFGGGLGASFGQYTNVLLAPLAGYKVTPKLTLGLGFNYQFVQLKEPNNINFFLDYKLNTIGPSAFAQYNVFYGLFLHTEFATQWYNLEYLEAPYFSASGNEQALFLGGGYTLGGNGRGGFQILALYNVLYNESNFVYWRPWNIRFAIMF
jgi:hypothetical protein